MAPSTSQKVVRKLIILFKYYHDIWTKRSHMLQPLSRLTPQKVKFKCTDVKQKYFEKIKLIAARKTLLVYPDFNYQLFIYTNTRNFQLLVVISQGIRLINFLLGK